METAARTSRPMGGMNFAFIHPRMLAATRQCLPLLCRTQTFKRIVSKPNPPDMRHKTGCGIISLVCFAFFAAAVFFYLLLPDDPVVKQSITRSSILLRKSAI